MFMKFLQYQYYKKIKNLFLIKIIIFSTNKKEILIYILKFFFLKNMIAKMSLGFLPFS